MKSIPSFPNYFATEDGDIIGPYKRKMYQSKDKDGYKVVRIRKDGRYWTKKVHRLVCEAYHGMPPENKNMALHKDGNNINNHPENLRWGNHSENTQDALLHFKQKGKSWAHWNRGEMHVKHKLTKGDVNLIRHECTNSAPRGTKAKMARSLGISASLITGILKRKAWKHI
jgi:hypothetical protein